jgi:diguanylate cyclase (GGDEF)-like protein
MLVQTPAIVATMLVPVGYLHRSSMVKALRQSSRQDSKTGLLNMPAWTDRAGGVLARCQRAGRAAAVLVIDVDHFKAVNDTRGHLVGDRVLLEVAHVLQRELRGHDHVGRFGGDEFVVLLDELAATEAEQAAHRLRDALRAIRVDDLAPSVSMGLAHSSRHGTNLTALLTAADHALYQAKAAGRDRLHVAPDPVR